MSVVFLRPRLVGVRMGVFRPVGVGVGMLMLDVVVLLRRRVVVAVVCMV
jgi:predicted Abi (CAAX) family protease